MLNADPLWPRAGDWPSPVDDEWADVALIGMPTSRTSLSPTQAHTTPAAVREALRRYAALSDLRIVDAGTVREPDLNEQGAIDAVAQLRAELVIALGGDNAATVPTALGRWGSEIESAGLITLDAHYDLRDGTSNGSPVRRLLEAGLDGSRVVQIGIEPLANSLAYAERAREAGITVITRDELRSRSMDEVMAQALEIAGAAGGPIHVDLDVDVCDRSVTPGCPASVPGGISAIELRTAARLAGAHPAVSSIDLVEVDAAADAPDERTVRLVALCVLEAIAGVSLR
ncbi:agmatinase family protein [Salinibacterium sp. NSLL150]|uniref:agmatinase family protein n=1 Tax=unclassified Salinibacterium TaxID=2632331 RepID=UPI0018CD2992|nr:MULTISPECIES: agmatinase family protein [unclassified Salinibacterium]MBH0098224.1 agmatinase family protein [Salinibacterium sp. NSLL35]MBH0100979.1 agmatinase family protein [Salinibacterium sp. NSLL150]MBH0103738.1 agmatinase family protein [Salinibacterium sp. NSLL16]MBH0106499.1 agmatinase family protein [Salinibacterium sp. NSLL17]